VLSLRQLLLSTSRPP